MSESANWIPVDERLPKEQEAVLVTIYPSYTMLCPQHIKKAFAEQEEVGQKMAKRLFETPRVSLAFYYTVGQFDGRWFFPDKNGTPIPEGWIVSAWAPIPEPYDHIPGVVVKLW